MKRIIISSLFAAAITATSFAQVEIHQVAQALQTGNNAIITQYLEEGGDPNANLMQGQTLVFASVATANIDALKQLIDAGANINDGGKMMGKKNMSPLFFAASMNNLEAAKVLLDAGANPNDNFMGQSIRSMPSVKSSPEMLKLLNEATLSHAAQSNGAVTVSSKTILSTLSTADMAKAKADAKNGKRLSYDMYEKGRSFWTAMSEGVNKSPVRLALFTPYSLYRHGYYEETQTFIPFSDAAKQAIIADKNKVYILPYSIVGGGLYGTTIKHLVIRKKGIVYQPEPLTNAYMQTYGHDFAYGFPIDLFDGEPLEVIAIDAQNDKQLIMPIDKTFFEKRNWY